MRMCDKTYNVLKWIAQLLLPAMDTFLGVILGITTAQYKQKQKTDAA